MTTVEPTALGAVLALLTDGRGKPVRGGAARGQMYVSEDGILVLRPTAAEQLVDRGMMVLLIGSVVAVVANLMLWRTVGVLWGAIVAQAIYWLALPARRRRLSPQPLVAAELDAARRAGRAAVNIPASAVTGLVAPEPPRPGFRKPARFELADGALEVYLSPEQFEQARAALRRTPGGP